MMPHKQYSAERGNSVQGATAGETDQGKREADMAQDRCTWSRREPGERDYRTYVADVVA